MTDVHKFANPLESFDVEKAVSEPKKLSRITDDDVGLRTVDSDEGSSEKEAIRLFKKYDHDNNKTLDPEAVSATVKGGIIPARSP